MKYTFYELCQYDIIPMVAGMIEMSYCPRQLGGTDMFNAAQGSELKKRIL